MKQIIFVTGNSNKLKEVRLIMNDYEVAQENIDIIEIQGTIEEIINHKARTAYQKLNKPCFVEDTSLCFAEWGELPGPYIKTFIHSMGVTGLPKALTAFHDKTATAIATLGYMDKTLEKPIVFQGKTQGQIVKPKGETRFEWDQIFLPDGFDKTYAELGLEIKNKISHRKKAINLLKKYLQTK